MLTVVSKPQQDPVNPCVPSPCGPYSECRVTLNTYTCTCLPNYQGSPPQCRPECVSNSDCSYNLACINMKCKDPCIGSCGLNAECHVYNHIPQCTCLQGYLGNPFVLCNIQQAQRKNNTSYYYNVNNMFSKTNFLDSKLRNYVRHTIFNFKIIYDKLEITYFKYILVISIIYLHISDIQRRLRSSFILIF